MITPTDIRKFLRNEGISQDQRVEKPNGGIYLRNLLLKFANEVRDDTLKEVVIDTRKKISYIDNTLGKKD